MFTVKLANNTVVEAKSVVERYGERVLGEKKYSLDVEVADEGHNITYYKGLLEAEGALGDITVTREDGTETVLTGYTVFERLERIIDTTGDMMRFSLTKE